MFRESVRDWVALLVLKMVWWGCVMGGDDARFSEFIEIQSASGKSRLGCSCRCIGKDPHFLLAVRSSPAQCHSKVPISCKGTWKLRGPGSGVLTRNTPEDYLGFVFLWQSDCCENKYVLVSISKVLPE